MSYASDIKKCTPEKCTGYCLSVGVRRCPAGQAEYDADLSREVKKKQAATQQQRDREVTVA